MTLTATVAASAGVFRLTLLGFFMVDALDRRDLASAASLVRRGAWVNAQGNDGTSPLLLASEPLQPATLRWLLKRGANPSLRDRIGQSPLGWAMIRHDPETARVLLDAGAIPDQRFLRTTPLEYAAVTGDLKLIQLLLDRGADVNLRDYDSRTPLEAIDKASLDARTREQVIRMLRARGAVQPLAEAVAGQNRIKGH